MKNATATVTIAVSACCEMASVVFAGRFQCFLRSPASAARPIPSNAMEQADKVGTGVGAGRAPAAMAAPVSS